MIIGKQVDNLNTPMIYKSPFQSLVDVSNNLISGVHDIGFWANKNTAYTGRAWDLETLNFKDSLSCSGKEVIRYEKDPVTQLEDLNKPVYRNGLIWDSGEIFQQGFTRLGLQAQFSTWLSEYNTAFGNYGLAVELTFRCLELQENNEFTNYIIFDSDSFFGDVYNFETYYTQEDVFDISDFIDFPIVRIKLFAYQRNNFRNVAGDSIYTEDEVGDEAFTVINPNIFIKDPYICLGIDTSEFTSDTATLITNCSFTYYKGSADAKTDEIQAREKDNLKTIALRWVHKDTEKDIIKTVLPGEIPTGYEIRWYRYLLGAPSPDQFAGAHWSRFYGCKRVPDENGEWVQDAYAEITSDLDLSKDYFYYDEDAKRWKEISIATLKLGDPPYTYYNNEEGRGFKYFSDELRDYAYIRLYESIDIATNSLEIEFQPNVNFQTEQIKAIIIKDESLTDDAEEEDRILRHVASSNIFTFTNNTDVRSRATVIEENTLAIAFQDEERGNYFIYNRAGQVGKEEDKEIRVLKAVFDPDESDVYKKADLEEPWSYIKWTFPSESEGTMIIPATGTTQDAVPSEQIIFENTTEVGFFIKPQLNHNANHNTVQLEVVKDGQEYTAQAQMLFGTAGTSGSNYTLVLNWENGENALNLSEKKYNGESSLTGRVYLLDQNGLLADIQADSQYEFSWYKVALPPGDGISHLEKVKDPILYPVQRNGILELADGLEASHFYGYDQYPQYLVNAIDNSQYFQYNLVESEDGNQKKGFTQFSGDLNNYGGILYRYLTESERNSFDKIEFREVVTIGPDEQEELELTSNSGKIITDRQDRKYYYSSTKRLFVKYNDTYIIDPWETYSEVETYYEPVITSQVAYNETLLHCTADDEIKGKFVLHGNPSINSLYILEVKLTNFGDYDLIAKYPVPIKSGESKHYQKVLNETLQDGLEYYVYTDNSYKRVTDPKVEEIESYYSVLNIDDNYQKSFVVDYIEGPTDVRYATTGETDFNKNPYQITSRWYKKDEVEDPEAESTYSFKVLRHGYNENNLLSGYWKLLYYIDENFNNDTLGSANNFLPSLVEFGGDRIKSWDTATPFDKPILAPPGLYFADTPLYGVQFVLGSSISDEYGNVIVPAETVLWTQPIYSFQDNYPSTTLNQWNGKDIVTDNDTGTIVANGLAAGKKERDNTFTGVVLGDWSRTDTDSYITKQTGVYGFNHGRMSYALKDDGTAFLGKDGRGRIYLSGNKAQIYSSHWLLSQEGMLLDIDDGYVKMVRKLRETPALFEPNTTGLHEAVKQPDQPGKQARKIYYKKNYEMLASVDENTKSFYLPGTFNGGYDFNEVEPIYNEGYWYFGVEEVHQDDTEDAYILQLTNENVPKTNFSDEDFPPQGNLEDEENYYSSRSATSYNLKEVFVKIDNGSDNDHKILSMKDKTGNNANGYTSLVCLVKTEKTTSWRKQKYFSNSGVQNCWAKYYKDRKTTYFYLTQENLFWEEFSRNNNLEISTVATEGAKYSGKTKFFRISTYIPYSDSDITIQDNLSSAKGFYFQQQSPPNLIYIEAGDHHNYDPSIVYYEADGFDKDRYITVSVAEKTWPLSVGTTKSPASRKFKVNWDGQLYATDGVFQGKITSHEGEIGGWIIDQHMLYSKYQGSDHNEEDGGNGVVLDALTGSLYGAGIFTRRGKIGGWHIEADRLYGGDTMLHSSQGIFTDVVKIKQHNDGKSWSYYGGMGYVPANFGADQVGQKNPGVGIFYGASATGSDKIFKVNEDNLGFTWNGTYMSIDNQSGGRRIHFGSTSDATFLVSTKIAKIHENTADFRVSSKEIHFTTDKNNQHGIYARFG